MKVLIDECVDQRLVGELQALGIKCILAEQALFAEADGLVLAYANAESVALVTMDTDFGELVFSEKAPAPMVILIRWQLRAPDVRAQVAGTIKQELSQGGQDFVVIPPGGVRRRPITTR